MALISMQFILFVLVGLLLYYIVPKSWSKYILFISNMVFAWFVGYECFFFLVFSIICVYLLGLLIQKSGKKCFLAIGISVFLIALFLFRVKDKGLFQQYLPDKISGLVVPLGFSFYSLSLIAYLCDIYKNKIQAETNFIVFSNYYSFFPRMFQGPVCRYSPSYTNCFTNRSTLTYIDFCHALQIIVWGLFKKLCIAAWLDTAVFYLYGAHSVYGSAVVFGSILYFIQLYTDFSGSIDVIIGIGQLYGVKLPENFRHPFCAESVTDFWRRWHISLSSWLKDYVYIPLGGSRKGIRRTYINLIIVFVVSGLWHGISADFLVWGLYNAFFIVIEKAFLSKTSFFKNENNILLRRVLTFLVISFSWIFFRSESLLQGLAFCKHILLNFNFSGLINNLSYLGLSTPRMYVTLLSVILLFRVEIIEEKSDTSIWLIIDRQPIVIRWIIYLGLVFSVLIFGAYGLEFSPEAAIYELF